MPEAARLLAVAESIADGSPVDWLAAEAHASAEEEAIIRQLRIVAQLAQLHRSLPADPPGFRPSADSTTHTTAPAIGNWGHLTLVQRIGGGGSGEVYRAWDQQLECQVALKLLRVEGATESGLSPIVKEGRLLARVRHPNVITVHGVAVHDGRFGLWMELVRGVTLEQLLAKQGPFSAREAALIGIDLCRALAAIHGAGLIHRDVKAQNVMREGGGRIVLMDLGTGRKIDSSRGHRLADLAGTPLYLAPELFKGAAASERSDLYSLGVLLYHLVTSTFPVRAAGFDELAEAHATGAGVRLRDARADLPTKFVQVVDRATARDPQARYASAGALEADLAAALDGTATPAVAEPGSVASSRLWSGWRAAAALLTALAAVVALIGLAWSANRVRVDRTGGPGPGAIRTIAVLPLENLSGDPALDYFADGMTDELIGTLGQLHGMNVISRTSTMLFRRSTKRLPEIAEALHADAILEGSVFLMPSGGLNGSTGRRARINARLIYAATDFQLWNKTFENAFDDVLVLQRDVANAVVEGIHVQLTPDQRRDLGGSNTRNAEAQDAYLLGRSYLTNSESDSLMKAQESLQRAVALDPGYARAHAALAVCDVWLELVGALPRAQARSEALDAADRALQLDPMLAEAHAVLADIKLFYDWDWMAAGVEYRRALELNPSYSVARGRYAWYLAGLGRVDEALREAKLAEEVDPLSSEAAGAVGMTLFYARRYDDALQQLRKALALAPGGAQQHNGLARAYAAKGQFPEAIREVEEARRLSGNAPPFVAASASMYALSGDIARARRTLGDLQQMAAASQVHVAPESFGIIYAALGDKDRAFQFLDQSVQQRDPQILWAPMDPMLDKLRDDPRFASFVRRIGIPQ